MASYHYNSDLKKISRCHASKKPCPYKPVTQELVKKLKEEGIILETGKEDEINNETYGISFEVAYARAYNIPVSPSYLNRSRPEIVDFVQNSGLSEFLLRHNIPRPLAHVAERQNPVDFDGENGITFSLKTNKGKMNRIAPQVIGQTTIASHFRHFENIYESLISSPCGNKNCLACSRPVPEDADARKQFFKSAVTAHPAVFLTKYWEKTFDASYIIIASEVSTSRHRSNGKPKFYALTKPDTLPTWKDEDISFTKSGDEWNESTSVKYFNQTIGEFQVHNNRDALKFRFNFGGLHSLSDKLGIKFLD